MPINAWRGAPAVGRFTPGRNRSRFPSVEIRTPALPLRRLSKTRVHLVLITSPSPLHSEQAVHALQAGKDVIVEIPVA